MKFEVTLPAYYVIKADGTKVKMTKQEIEEYERTHEMCDLVLCEETVCKLGIKNIKITTCQECPYFDECYVEQLEEISDGKDD